MAQSQITWYLKANKKNINDSNNYIEYSNYDDKYLISPSLMESVIETLTSMNYNIQTYEFINHHEHCAKWCIVFDIDDYNIFRKTNLKQLILFTSGLYETSSIYVRHICNTDDNVDNKYSDTDDEWEKIYKKI